MSIPLPDLIDEAATRRAYEFYLKQPHAPRISFEQYALAYGEKREPTDEELHAEYLRFCVDLKRNFPGVEGGYFGSATFDEFKTAHQGGSHV